MSEKLIISKRPSDSTYQKVLPFSSDSALHNHWKNYFGDLRFGKLLEEMDMAAGIISYRHSDGFDRNLTIVTAACDSIDLLAPLRGDCDLRIKGQVNHVGNSSMEIGLRLESLVDGQWLLVARAFFIMVARKGDEPALVNRLEITNDQDKRRFENARARQTRMSQERQDNLMKHPPDGKESAHLHELYLETRGNMPAGGVSLGDTRRNSTILMHPQDRNIHNKIFGGYIMRQSFEMGWNVAHLFCRQRPLFLKVDHFYFYKPVAIGSMVTFTGVVVFTGTTSFVVEVTAEVVHPMSGLKELTNVSYFTFVAVNQDKKPISVPKVYPYSYEDGLKYLDGRRRYLHGKEVRAKRNCSL